MDEEKKYEKLSGALENTKIRGFKKDKNYEKLLSALDNEKLLDIIKNFNRYGYPEEVVCIAQTIISSRISPNEIQNYKEQQQREEKGKSRYYQKLKDVYFECQKKWKQLSFSLVLMTVSLVLIFIEFWMLSIFIASVLVYFALLLQLIARVADLKQTLRQLQGKPEEAKDQFAQFILLVTFLGIFVVTASRYFNLRSEVRVYLDQEGVSLV